MTHLVPIGNSLGILIPKALIEQVGINKETDLELKVVDEGLLILPSHTARRGWGEAFKQQGRKEKLLLGESISNQFDKDEWEW